MVCIAALSSDDIFAHTLSVSAQYTTPLAGFTAGTGSPSLLGDHAWLRRPLEHFHVIDSPLAEQTYNFPPHIFSLIQESVAVLAGL